MSAEDIIGRLRSRRIDHVALGIAEKHHVPLSLALSDSKARSCAQARHEIRSVVTSTLGLSFPEAGRLFGVDHTTIIHSIEVRELLIARDAGIMHDPHVRQVLDRMQRRGCCK